MRMVALMLAAVVVLPAWGQEPATPGPEHAQIKKREGTWTATMKAGGMTNEGVATNKMDLGGLWLVSSLEMKLGDQKFHGKSMESYDTKKKKYVSVWFDSMSTTPMMMEGSYSKDKKTITMIGDGPGMDGKPAKWKSVSKFPDDDTIEMAMYVGEAKEPMFTMTYKRKK
jgi:hypothetical protein